VTNDHNCWLLTVIQAGDLIYANLIYAMQF
jgi:hypothetical protein